MKVEGSKKEVIDFTNLGQNFFKRSNPSPYTDFIRFIDHLKALVPMIYTISLKLRNYEISLAKIDILYFTHLGQTSLHILSSLRNHI